MENFKNFINEESDFEIEIGKEITPNDPSVKNVPIYELTPKEEILGWFIKTKIDREELGKDTNINPDVKHLTGKKLEELFPKKYLDQIFNKNLKEFFGPRVSEYANSPCGVRTLAGIFDVSDDYLFYDMNYARYWREARTSYHHYIVQFLNDYNHKVYEVKWKRKRVKGFSHEKTPQATKDDILSFDHFTGLEAARILNRLTGMYMIATSCASQASGTAGHIMSVARGNFYDTNIKYTQRCLSRMTWLVKGS